MHNQQELASMHTKSDVLMVFSKLQLLPLRKTVKCQEMYLNYKNHKYQ